ncbi:MAG: hypothetical protein H0X45_06720, partial [Planctomycetes bacterium]|nr:hypothetical protein [Planctomycetota bacterium]
ERARAAYDLAAAPGERLTLRLAATAHADVGICRFAVSALTGPATISADAARIFVTEHRVRGDGVHEAGLRPQDQVASEAGMTRCFWAWLSVPDDAPAGVYAGSATITPERGAARSFPIVLTVHPFRVRAPSWSLGMYYNIPADERIQREQLRFKRAIGFTATSLPAGRVTGIAGDRVQVEFDEAVYRRVKEEGFGADPGHLQMSAALPIARGIARSHLGFGARVDQRPGSELTDARLKPLYQDWLRQYAEFIRAQGMPVAVEIVDEPREVPNPWNRTLDQTNTYADWMREVGFAHGFVTPMGDSNGGRDYVSLADHAGIVSIHAGAGSRRLMERTLELGKPLWFYNTGMDRLSWGFYAWRAGVTGRWEWHFLFDDAGSGAPGYPNGEEWYNPFTGRDGMTTRAPATYPGAMLFKSAFFAAAEGIRDAAYLATLEDAMRAARGNAAQAAALARAEAFLADLRREIPLIIDVHGLGGEDSGALVGQGLQSSIEARCEAWRRRAAGLIAELRD